MELNLKLGNAELSVSNREPIYKIGYWSAIAAFLAASGYGFVQILQVLGVVESPLADILIYGTSLCISIPYLVAILALHYTAPATKRFWSHGSLVFAIMYCTYVILMYVVQLGAVIPYKITDPVLTVTPHSLFWILDALGYICLGFSTFFAVPIFSKFGNERLTRNFLLANSLMTPVITFVYFYKGFSIAILMLGLPWIVTAPGAMLMLGLHFKHQENSNIELTAV